MPPRNKNTTTPAAPAAPTVEEAAERRAAATNGVKPADCGMVDALLIERRGYQQRGMDDRVALVDEQLRLRGYRTA